MKNLILTLTLLTFTNVAMGKMDEGGSTSGGGNVAATTTTPSASSPIPATPIGPSNYEHLSERQWWALIDFVASCDCRLKTKNYKTFLSSWFRGDQYKSDYPAAQSEPYEKVQDAFCKDFTFEKSGWLSGGELKIKGTCDQPVPQILDVIDVTELAQKAAVCAKVARPTRFLAVFPAPDACSRNESAEPPGFPQSRARR